MQPKNKAHNATAYQFQKGEEILVDANVWLYLFPPPAQPASTWATKYTTAFSVMLKCNAVPIVDTLILSEYCNRYIRIEYEASWAETYRRYKDFRTSADAQAVLGSVVSEMERILQSSRPEDTALTTINLSDLLQGVASGKTDFNDGVLLENCRLNNWKLFTNDGDMTIGGIDILTTNQRLLRNCPP